MTDEHPAIRVAGVTKKFRVYKRRETTLKAVVVRRRRGVWDDFNALDDVSFDIPAGQVVGIVGRNGSGKSTLLKLLAKILNPDAGSISIEGRVSALLELGAGFHPEYSAIENVFLSGAIYGLPRAYLEAKVDEIIAFADLERFADNPVKTYSSGMYARLGFAIAVNVDPDVLLVDEVLAVGDQTFQARCLDRMLEFRDSGRTIVLVTHDGTAVESFCDRAIWIDEGRIQLDGLPHDVLRGYTAAIAEWEGRRRGEPATAADSGVRRETAIGLSAISFHAATGEEVEVVHNGDSLEVRIELDVHEPVRGPVCEILLERHDGVQVTATSTRLAGLEIPPLPVGPTRVSWRVDDVRLTPGTYQVSVKLLDATGARELDQRERWALLRVHAGRYRERLGVVVLDAVWEIESSLEPPDVVSARARSSDERA